MCVSINFNRRELGAVVHVINIAGWALVNSRSNKKVEKLAVDAFESINKLYYQLAAEASLPKKSYLQTVTNMIFFLKELLRDKRQMPNTLFVLNESLAYPWISGALRESIRHFIQISRGESVPHKSFANQASNAIYSITGSDFSNSAKIEALFASVYCKTLEDCVHKESKRLM